MIKLGGMSRSNWGLLLPLCLVLVVTWGPRTSALEPEKCAAQSRQIIVNPDAEAFIGVVLPVRAAGAGLLGCGLPTQDGQLKYITYGGNNAVQRRLRIWDTCGHSNEVAHALAELLPVLREGPALCTPGLATNGSSLLVGIVDGAGATKDPAIRLTLTQYSVPAVVSLAQELHWRQVAIVYGSDDYGTRMYRAAVRLAADSDLCVVAAERLGSDEDSRTAQATLAAVRNAATVAAATPRGSNVTGVLVLSRRSHYLPLLDTLRHTDTQGLQWLFSDLLTTSDINNGLSSDRFFSLTLAPPSIPPFEQYWANQVQQSGRNIDNNLVQEFEMTRRGCRLPGWAGPNISELPNCNAEPPKRDSPDSLRAAMRGRNAAAALHVVHTLAYALRAAWRENCQGAGVCPGLRLISRQEFSSKYLSPLEFDHAEPGSRVTGLPRGGKLRAGDPSEMAASSLALLSYRGDRSEKLHKYHLDGVEVSDRSFRSQGNRVDLSCSDEEDQGQCPRCLKLREARVRGSTSARSVSTSAPRLPAHHTISSPQHVYIAGIFSVHNAPLPGSPLLGECGPVIPTAARQVEAFTWALRRVNERILAPLGIKLGAVLLDTCQSAARALTLPAALIGETSEPILAAVNGLSDEEAKAATSVFTALNVTTVATASHRVKEERYSLQIAPAVSSMASAVLGVLQHLGWDYVSVLTSQGDDAAELGVKSLREGPVCIAMEETLDDLQLETVLAKLVAAKEGGARGIVLWTKPQDTRRLFSSVARARAAGSLKSDELFWLVVDPQNEATAILEEFGDVIGGAIVFSSIHSPLSGSLSHCGSLSSPDALQRAAALAFAIEKANLASNFSGLSALLLDDCSLPSRAVYRTFGFLANTLDNSTIVSNPNSVAVTLLMDNIPNEGLSSLLSSQGIPVVLTEEEDSVIRARLHAALGVAHELGWSRLIVVRKEGSRWSKRTSDMLLNEILPVTKTNCLGGELVVDINSDHLAKNLQAEISLPLILLFEKPNEVEAVLNVLSEIRHRSRVIIVSGWDSNTPINNTMDADIFTVTQDINAEIIPGFREYVAASITTDTGVLPSDWIAEFLETANTGKWQQAQGVPDIIRIVSWIAEELKRLCYQDEENPLCGQDASKFREEIRATLAVKMSARAPNLVIHRHNTAKSYEKVGSWKKVNGLSVSVKKWRRVDTNNECESYRVGRSGKLTSVLEEIPSPPGSLLGELRMLWGVICAALSVLGALLTIALVVYFASATRHAAGTSILGYQILFGVLLLYGSIFAFLMSPSEITCLLRRLLPGLAYAVVLSGMLVKVVTTWRCQGCTKGSLPDGDPLSRPCGLLCCAMALVVVQAFLAGGWLLLVPADVEPPTNLEESWTCAAASGRELLGSLSFLAALLVTTAFVSLKARKDGESRSILACCVLLAVAGGAWVAAANSPTLADHHRDCVAGVIAGLVSATLVLLCVFVPKLLQHARLSREQERHQQQQQHAAVISHSKLQPVMYGVPHYPSVSSPHTLVIKAFPEPDELMGVEHMMSSSRGGSETTLEDDGSEPELAAIRDAEERSSSSGSGRLGLLGDHTLQVPSPLYPMDMFTGPPPTTSTFGHGAPPPPPMPRFSLVDHRVPGSNEFTAPPPPSEGAHGGDLDLSKHDEIGHLVHLKILAPKVLGNVFGTYELQSPIPPNILKRSSSNKLCM
ncbi:hypothetical protein B566_EDAN007473 [Ephemera danica]|nr:hypothetical protein B566_EDAN007473 [Ephemera danica]